MDTSANAVKLLEMVLGDDIPGDVVEVGILCGTTGRKLCKLSREHGRIYLGFDSFEGMGDPGPEDMRPDGSNPYPRGKFAGRGLEYVKSLYEGDGNLPGRDFVLVKGFIPQTFRPFNLFRFCFAYLDVDHYQPTLDGLDWLWERIEPGGYLLCDDYFDHEIDRLATKAINEWMETLPRDAVMDNVEGPKRQIAFRKKV